METIFGLDVCHAPAVLPQEGVSGRCKLHLFRHSDVTFRDMHTLFIVIMYVCLVFGNRLNAGECRASGCVPRKGRHGIWRSRSCIFHP